jgi:UDP-N-acetylglucosamine/UDP-N-acetylgalactosamine diphosphorylase
MSRKMLPKAYPKEKLGNFCLIDGKMTVIEYSDLPDELAEQRLGGPNGELRFRAGSIALHAIRRDFVESLNRPWHGRPAHDGPQAVPSLEKGSSTPRYSDEHGQDAHATEGGNFALPFHRADKKIPCIDLETGQPLKPEKNNGIKLETFVFDALPLTTKSIIYETDRQDEFAPIKNADGIDSPQSSSDTTTARNAAWLESAGIHVPRKGDGTPDCVIEIAPSFALYQQDVPAKKGRVPAIRPGDRIYLE